MKLRLLTILAVLVVLGFTVLSASMLWDMRKEARAHDIRQSRNLMTAEADDIRRTVGLYDLSLRSAAAALLDAGIAGTDPRLRQLSLFERTATAPYLGAIRILDPDGNVTHDSATLRPIAINDGERDALNRHRLSRRMGLFISKPLDLGAGQAGNVDLSRRLETSDGRFAGIVSGTIQLSYFSDLFERLRLGPHDVVSLFQEDGTLLAHAPGSAHVGQTILGSATWHEFGLHGNGTFTARSAFDGTRRIYTFEHLDGLPLLLDVGLSEQDVFRSWRHKALLIGGCLLAMAGTSIALLLALHHELQARTAAEQEAQTNEARYRLLADNSSDVILRFDSRLRRTYVSPSCFAYGYRPEELSNATPETWAHPDDRAVIRASIRQAQDAAINTEIVYRIRCSDGRDVWVEGRYNYVCGDGGFIAVLRDVDRRKAVELELEQANAALRSLAAIDALTGLANRRSFDERLNEEWRRASRAGENIAILVIDVDQFKKYNDHYGHQSGDRVLKAVAAAIGGGVRRPGDFAARYGGEEFIIILPNTDLYGAIEVAESVRHAVLDGNIPHVENAIGIVSVSIGAASVMAGEAGLDRTHLFAIADDALYAAKSLGRNQVHAKLARSGLTARS